MWHFTNLVSLRFLQTKNPVGSDTRRDFLLGFNNIDAAAIVVI